ncbi:MAG: TonB-dependent receptor plug domain-containing protein [Ignavibacteriaceae bacterium]
MSKVGLLLVILSLTLLPRLSEAAVPRLFSADPDSVSPPKDFYLDQIVVTASRIETKNNNTPTRIEVIEKSRISSINGTRLVDILNTASSIHIKSYGLTPSLNMLGMNGSGSEHTLIMLDGVRMNSPQNSVFDLSLLPLESINRIEIQSNGASSLYGSDAMAGVINIFTNYNGVPVTEKPINITLSSSLSSFRTQKHLIKLSKAFKSLTTHFFFNRESGRGNFDYYFNNGAESILKERSNSSFSNFDLGFTMQYFIDSLSRFRFYSSLVSQDKELAGLETGTPPPTSNQTDKNWNNIFSYEQILTGNTSFTIALNFQNNLMKYRILPFINSIYKNLVSSVQTHFRTEFKVVKISSGYEFMNAVTQSKELDGLVNRNQHSGYITSEVIISDLLRIFPSVRYDNFSDLGNEVITGRIGINFRPISSLGLHVKGNMGTNFRAPTFNDLYWKDSGNPSLHPEKSVNSEIGIAFHSDYLISTSVDLGYTYIKATDKIVWTPKTAFIWTPKNIASSYSKVLFLNITLRKNITDNFGILTSAGITLNEARKTSKDFPTDPSFDKYIFYVPQQSIKANLMLTWQSLGLNFFFIHSGKRFADMENKRPLSPHNLLDGNLSYTFNFLHFSAQAKFEINNITNTDYQVISGYPMPLRNYLLKIIFNY